MIDASNRRARAGVLATMKIRVPNTLVAVGVAGAVFVSPALAAGDTPRQQAPPAAAPADAPQTAQPEAPAATSPLDARTRDIIRTALESPPLLRDERPRFRLDVTVPFPTFAEYVRGVDFGITPIDAPTSGPRFGGSFGGGLDLGSLLGAWREQMRERETRRVRARIDAELRALDAANAAARAKDAAAENATGP